MKRYTNITNSLKQVVFINGEAQFLFRGQSFESDLPTEALEDGIEVADVEKSNKKSNKQTDQSAEV
jgi:hypothetical protein